MAQVERTLSIISRGAPASLPSRHPGFIAVYVIPETGETYELRDADMARLPWHSTFQHADGRVTRTLRRSLEVAS